MKISIKKTTRTVEIPDTATKEYLIDIICKWAPIIANDTCKDKYTYKPIDTKVDYDFLSSVFGKNSNVENLKNIFGFNKK
jgi:hypothetical protein